MIDGVNDVQDVVFLESWKIRSQSFNGCTDVISVDVTSLVTTVGTDAFSESPSTITTDMKRSCHRSLRCRSEEALKPISRAQARETLLEIFYNQLGTCPEG